jgi:DNA polymerase I-like protein with 3'-5' exonuclease and polymerase domains
MNVYVFDIETNGLLNEVSKLHCLSYYDGELHSLTSYDEIKNWLANADILIGHNIIQYDIPVLEKLLKIKITAKLIDTLALSWYLEPQRNLHGLESWGEEFGVPKPVIKNWNDLSVTDYIHRCEEDVKINTKLWKRFRRHLITLYGSMDEADKIIEYLSFKMDCAREQERSKWKIDKAYVEQSLQKLTEAHEAKLATLVAGMPTTPVYALRKAPEKPFKKDGTLSVAGVKWKALLKEHKYPPNYTGEIKEKVKELPPNPASSKQVKDWLFSLGWEPTTFKYIKNEDGTLRKIPQIKDEHSEDLCPSVLALIEKTPIIADLQGLGIISHRISILNGFLDYAKESDYIVAGVQGLTNTLRFKHRVAVNLPKVGKPYGEEIRGALIADEGYELCGSDMASLEDRLKQHFLYPYDPEYVKEMSTDDYDPHLSLALLAKEITQEQMDKYKSGVDKSIKPIRDIFKNGNYACQYGAGPARLALTANISLEKAEQVWKTYWKKNSAIKKVAEAQEVKTVNGQMWLYNPISHFWYSLRYEKDRFSTLIQGTAAFVFDEWVKIFRSKRPQLTAQFHDEVVLEVKKGFRKECEKLLRSSIEELNSRIKLNRELGIDVQFGDRYSSIH